jgi:hypothetical protein
MRQDQFDSLLSWTMLNALNSALIFEQNQKQRPLTQEEVEDCMQRHHGVADVVVDFLRGNRSTLHKRAGRFC